MKISTKMLSIPPYLSTTWTQVRALYLKGSDLIVCLNDNTQVAVPSLTSEAIAAIFAAHTAFLEMQSKSPALPEKPHPFQIFTAGQGLEGSGLENIASFSSTLQHNPAQATMPDLPKEIIHKIGEISKIIAPNEVQNLPKPEANCNCPYCQIARAIHEGIENVPEAKIEEDVTEEDLKFPEWDIQQIGEKLYTVTGRLDPKEKYNVFLGDPVGCTCGKPGCEHILAVLKS